MTNSIKFPSTALHITMAIPASFEAHYAIFCDTRLLCCLLLPPVVRNTLHVDDLTRNFALNPHNGVKCSAWYRDKAGAQSDSELPLLAAYLNHVASTAAPQSPSSFSPSSSSSSSLSISASSATVHAGSSEQNSVEHNFLKWDHSKWREIALGIMLASAHPLSSSSSEAADSAPGSEGSGPPPPPL